MIPDFDACDRGEIIAATALDLGLPLISRDGKIQLIRLISTWRRLIC